MEICNTMVLENCFCSRVELDCNRNMVVMVAKKSLIGNGVVMVQEC